MRLMSLYRLAKPSFSNTFHYRSICLSAKRLALTTFKLSDIGEGINEVQLLKWDKKVGDQVDEMESVCTVQSDKAAVEITSRYTGTVKKLYVNEGDTIKIGSPLMDIDTVDEVHENNVNDDTSKFGSQKREYSTLTNFKKWNLKETSKINKVFFTTGEEKDKKEEDVVEVKLNFIGKAMVKSMVESLQVPHVTVGEEVDLTDLTKLYKWYRTNPPPTEEGKQPPKITITPFIIKALSLALEKVPIMNSKFNGDSYLQFKNHNISVAINTPHGLMVPNIKNVNKLTVRQIQEELTVLQQKASKMGLQLNDIKGGTCTLSNLGTLGGTFINARLFDGQAAIIAVGRSINRVVPVFPPENKENPSKTNEKEPNFTLEARSICSVGVTADHRHIDGATIATFISHFKAFLQDTEGLKKYF